MCTNPLLSLSDGKDFEKTKNGFGKPGLFNPEREASNLL